MEISFDLVKPILDGQTFVDQAGNMINKQTLNVSNASHKVFVDIDRYNAFFVVNLVNQLVQTMDKARFEVILLPKIFTFFSKPDTQTTSIINPPIYNPPFQGGIIAQGLPGGGSFGGLPGGFTNIPGGGTGFGSICAKDGETHDRALTDGLDSIVNPNQKLTAHSKSYSLELLAATCLFVASFFCYRRR